MILINNAAIEEFLRRYGTQPYRPPRRPWAIVWPTGREAMIGGSG